MSNSKYIIAQQEVLGHEIRALTKQMEPLLVGKSKAAALISMISMATLIQAPDLSTEQLKEIVSDVSKRIALLIDAADTDAPTIN